MRSPSSPHDLPKLSPWSPYDFPMISPYLRYGTTEATVYQAAYEIPRAVADLDDAAISEHAHTIGTPFEGITMVAMPAADDGEDDCVEMAEGTVVVGGAQAEQRLMELVLHGVQVDGGTAAGFRTGDLVRRTAVGQLAFVGRADRQVKLDGRRIELGPIEAAISRRMSPLVQRTVVQLVGVPGRLHAFCQSEEPECLGAASGAWSVAHAATVRQLCALELPRHLVPAGVTFLDQLPVTPTGKTDQRALASMHKRACLAVNSTLADEAGKAWAPEGWLRTVACCWAAELGLPLHRLSARSNFQSLSGNSLVALRIGSRLWQQRTSCLDESGGAFGERMGVFAPLTLLSTPVLEEYAAALAASAVAVAVQSAPEMEAAFEAEPATAGLLPDGSTPGASPASPASAELDKLAGHAVSVDAVALLRLLLRQQQYVPTAAVADGLLVSAVHGSSNACAELLLLHGASPNAIGIGGSTVLHCAVQHRNTALAQTLLSSRADVRATDDNQQTALHHAARTGGDAQCFEMLFRSYASSSAETAETAGTAETAQTAEMGEAAEAAEAAEADECTDGGACGLLDKWGRLPLHWAIVNGHRDAMVALVEVGGSQTVWLRDFQNQSSMDLAEQRASCREWLTGSGNDGARCDQITLSMLKLMAGGPEGAPAA